MKGLKRVRRSIKYSKINWDNAPDIKKRVKQLVSSLEIENFDTSRIYCFRSVNAKTRAYARIWGFAKIWQIALDQKPAYILEVISEKFDKLNYLEQDKVLLHELVHIPKNFSGALVPHRKRGAGNFHDKLRELIVTYQSKK